MCRSQPDQNYKYYSIYKLYYPKYYFEWDSYRYETHDENLSLSKLLT